METKNNVIKIDIENVDFFPSIIDYDFKKNRPRGGSSRIDFFAYGRLSLELDKVKIMSNLFVKKKNMMFDKGIFLVDFSQIDSQAKDISEMISNFGTKKIYIENSKDYSIDSLIELLDEYEIIYLDF